MKIKRIRKVIFDTLVDSIPPVEHEVKGQSILLDYPECIALLNVQASTWGGCFYINIGISVKKLSKRKNPHHCHCHVQSGLELLVKNRPEYDSACRYDNEQWNAQGGNPIVIKALISTAIPIIQECATLGGIKRAYKSGKLDNFLVDRRLQKLLK